jgi:hypothetical protein
MEQGGGYKECIWSEIFSDKEREKIPFTHGRGDLIIIIKMKIPD